MKRAWVATTLMLLMAVPPLWGAQRPWTKDQIIRMLKGDVPPKRVGELARERGIDFPITSETETEVRQATTPGGAAVQEIDALLGTLREIAPKPAIPLPPPEPAVLVVESVPGGVQVYVDDVFKGATSQEGKLKVIGLAPGQHQIRLSLQGYGDKEGQVEAAAGITQTYSAYLTELPHPKPVEVPAEPVAPAPVPIIASFQLWHFIAGFANSHFGNLVLTPGHVSWTEEGRGAKPEDNFSLSCAEIVNAGKNGLKEGDHIRLQGRNYIFMPTAKGRRTNGFEAAISSACPSVVIN